MSTPAPGAGTGSSKGVDGKRERKEGTRDPWGSKKQVPLNNLRSKTDKGRGWGDLEEN